MMSKRHLKLISITSIMFGLGISACNMQSGSPGPRIWIDAPLDGSTVALGPVVVQSHSASDSGTAQVKLLVNGTQVQIDQATDASNDLAAFSQVWIPQEEGQYSLQVVAVDPDGNESLSTVVRVLVGPVPIDLPTTETPVAGATTTPDPVLDDQPTLILISNANCRRGPGTVYEVVDAYLAGQQLRIIGRNDNGSWFVVNRPGSNNTCWVSASTGTPSGEYGSVQVVIPPPLPEATQTDPAVVPPPPVVQGTPSAPGNFNVFNQSCLATGYVVGLSWNDASGEQGYRVYRDGGLIATLGEGVTSYSDNSPDFNSHGYLVEAFNGSGAANTPTKNSEGCLY